MGTPVVDAGMRVVHRPPSSPVLAPLVGSLGYFEGRFPHAAEMALPTGAMQLLVSVDPDEPHFGAALQGPYAGPAVIDPAQQRAVVWVAFRAGGAYPFFAPPAAEAAGRLVGLELLWGREGAVLRERLREAVTSGGPGECLDAVERVLLGRAVRAVEPDPAVRAAVAALDRGDAVGEAADRLGWTSRRLARRFAEQVGLTPKRFARVRRLQRVLGRAGGGEVPDWARVAAECGYHDQAHLIHEFRALAGMTPTEYRPRSPGERNHVPLER